MMKESRSVSFHKILNFSKIRVSAKVWKVKINFPCGFGPKEDVAGVDSIKWTIRQVLN